jgi:hypothetical protein
MTVLLCDSNRFLDSHKHVQNGWLRRITHCLKRDRDAYLVLATLRTPINVVKHASRERDDQIVGSQDVQHRQPVIGQVRLTKHELVVRWAQILVSSDGKHGCRQVL